MRLNLSPIRLAMVSKRFWEKLWEPTTFMRVKLRLNANAIKCFSSFNWAGQGRLDGAFCDYTKADKMAFLNKLRDMGVVNIEMEGIKYIDFLLNLFKCFSLSLQPLFLRLWHITQE